jgi:large subunit ribosomal protein L33
MHSTLVVSMARGKAKSIPIKLLSSVGTGYFYVMRKNPTRSPEKVALIKYDPVVKRRVLFHEHKLRGK